MDYCFAKHALLFLKNAIYIPRTIFLVAGNKYKFLIKKKSKNLNKGYISKMLITCILDLFLSPQGSPGPGVLRFDKRNDL